MILEEAKLKINIDTTELDKILEKRDCQQSTYIIMNENTAKLMKMSNIDGMNYPLSCQYWKGCKVLFDNDLEISELKIFQ